MEKEKHVCALKYAKELKELGYPQDDSLWYWIVDLQTQKEHLYRILGRSIYKHQIDYETYAAPTVAEFGEVLPDEIIVDKMRYFCSFAIRVNRSKYTSYTRYWYGYQTNRYETRNDKILISFDSDTEANVRSMLVVYLIRNKIIKVKDL